MKLNIINMIKAEFYYVTTDILHIHIIDTHKKQK